jgi:hypothetical protein
VEAPDAIADDSQEEDGDAVADCQEEKGDAIFSGQVEEKEDKEDRWARLQAKARAKAESRTEYTDDEEDPKHDSLVGDTSSSNAISSFEELTSRKRCLEDSEAGRSNMK